MLITEVEDRMATGQADGTIACPLAVSEPERAEVIQAYDLAGYREDGGLDDLASFAAELCQTEVALVSLVEEARQRFLAAVGFDQPETARDTSFCAHAMLGDEPVMVIPDAQLDPRFAPMSLVAGPPHIRVWTPLRIQGGVGEILAR
ncbi:GAF domain-containing protein, partial [Sphingomonas paucimobilis]